MKKSSVLKNPSAPLLGFYIYISSPYSPFSYLFGTKRNPTQTFLDLGTRSDAIFENSPTSMLSWLFLKEKCSHSQMKID